MNVLAFLLAAYVLFGRPFVSPTADGGDGTGQTGGLVNGPMWGPSGGPIVGSNAGPNASPIGGPIGVPIDMRDLRVCCEKILREGQRIWFLSDRNGKMKLQVKGIYIHGTALLFLLQLTNRSSRDYSIDAIRFQPSDKAHDVPGGRLALEPLFIYDSTKLVPGYGRASSIFVLPRFTLPPGGKLWIEMRETNGGRLLHIPINNWMLARARII